LYIVYCGAIFGKVRIMTQDNTRWRPPFKFSNDNSLYIKTSHR